jgi:hypothetical protein
MQTSSPQSWRLRDYTNIKFEILIVALSLIPFLVLAYFYAELPDRLPMLLNLKGEVITWVQKSALSVFRLPLMAIVIQVVCLLMKYGALQSSTGAPLNIDIAHTKLQEQYLGFSVGLWDGLRWAAAVKMSAESLDTVFLSLDRFRFLSRPAFIISAVAAAVGVVLALIYCYRLLVVRREIKR